MLNDRRALVTCCCFLLSAGWLLDSSEAVAATGLGAFQSGSVIHSVKNDGFAMVNGQRERIVKVTYDAKHSLSTGVVKYARGGALVPVSTFRAGAVNVALKSGRLVPGLGIALTAASIIWDDEIREFLSSTDSSDGIDTSTWSDEFIQINNKNIDGQYWESSGSRGTFRANNPIGAIKPYLDVAYADLPDGYILKDCSVTRKTNAGKVTQVSCSGYDAANPSRRIGGTNASFEDSPYSGSDSPPVYYELPTSETSAPVPIDSPIWDSVDEHIPASIADDIYSTSAQIPDWEDTISVIPFGNTVSRSNGGGSSSRGGVAPEIIAKVAQDQQNLDAASRGEEQPYPDAQTDPGQSASDQMFDDLNSADTVPDFAEPETDWQTETIDALPSFSLGVGEGSCPAPVKIGVAGISFELSYQILCDFSGMIRPVLIAICFLLSLYIVLGHSRGGE